MKIGLTGGIGSGKSTVARWLTLWGAQLVDTDAIAHELTAAGGAAMPALVAAFGPEVTTPEGALDRQRMRERVFADEPARKTLESILHPLIGQVARTRAGEAGTRPVVLDIPLLAENWPRWQADLDRVLVIDCTESTQCKRVMSRNGWSAEQAQRIIARQASRQQRQAIADAVILNEDIDLPTLREEVRRVWTHWGLPDPGHTDPVEQ